MAALLYSCLLVLFALSAAQDTADIIVEIGKTEDFKIPFDNVEVPLSLPRLSMSGRSSDPNFALMWSGNDGDGMSQLAALDGEPQEWLTNPSAHRPSIGEAPVSALSFGPLAMHHQLGAVFFLDNTNSAIQYVLRSNMASGNTFMTGLHSEINAMAVDWLANNIYLADGRANAIAVISLTVSAGAAAVVRGIQDPRGVAVYPQKSYLFWTEAGDRPKIERSGLAGENRVALVTSNLARPHSITIDYSADRIYWTDSRRGTITGCSLTGSGLRVLADAGGNVLTGIALYGEYVFAIDNTESGIHIRSTRDSSLMKMMLVSISEITDVMAYTSDNQPQGNSPCNTADCQHICVSAQSNTQARCLCGGYTVLQADRRSCAEAPTTRRTTRRTTPRTTSRTTSRTTPRRLPVTATDYTGFTTSEPAVTTECPIGFVRHRGKNYRRFDHVRLNSRGECEAACARAATCRAYVYSDRNRKHCRHVTSQVNMGKTINNDNFDLFVKERICSGACQTDVIFIVDSSKAVGKGRGKKFKRIRQFIQSIIALYSDEPSRYDVRFSAIQFDTTARLTFGLDQYTSASDVIEAAGAMRVLPGRAGRNIAAALRLAIGNPGDRPEVPNHVVLVTAGTTGRAYKRQLWRSLDALKATGARVTVVDVTASGTNRELRNIATSDPDMYFRVKSFSNLKTALENAVAAGILLCVD